MEDDGDLAIICGSGKLPSIILDQYKNAVCVTFGDLDTYESKRVINCQFEKLGFLFKSLKRNGIKRVVMAGAISRPIFDESKLDEYTLSIMPQLKKKLTQGDNELLSFIALEFEKKGFEILGAAEILPKLTVDEGFITGFPYENLCRDIEKADNLLKVLSPQDIGQGVVIENGLVLGIETLQGTNALLKFVETTSSELRKVSGGIFVKRPKFNQDLRFDMPVIGSETIELACKAGLRGLVISPGSVIILDLVKCVEISKANNFFIFAKETLH